MNRLDLIAEKISDAKKRGVRSKDLEFLLQIALFTRRMRSLQQNYFKTRDRSVLIESKRSEVDVDAMLSAGVPEPSLEV